MRQSPVVAMMRVLSIAAMLLMLVPCSVAAEDPLPTLHLDFVPAYGVSGRITGTVSDASGGLAVVGYVRIDEGGRRWGPKPTSAHPSVPVEDDGSFTLTFITGGTDIDALTIYVLLIPDTYVPGSSYEEAESVAVDQLIVARTPEGAVTILPREGQWVRPDPTPTATAMPAPAPTATPTLAPTSLPALLPTLHLDFVPAYGVSGRITGTVSDASGGLAVVGYVRIDEGGRRWGPKPTSAHPSVPVEDDGSFTLTFITGGTDINALTIYVLLIPDTYVPGSSYEEAESVAVDQLIVARTPEGAVTILPREGQWVRPDPTPTATTMPAPAPTATPTLAPTPLPTLHLDYVPAYGGPGRITGTVSDASGGLAVVGYVQVSEGGQRWGPKPTSAHPSVPVEADGSFTLTFETDVDALVIYVLLIPDTYVPGGQYEEAESMAIDKLVVARTPDGAVTILPREGQWVRPETTISICYSPYTHNQSPELGSPVPLAQMATQLETLRPYVGTIRTFGVTGELAKLYPVAKNQYGYRVIAGCWLGATYTEAQIKAELDALIDVANRGLCDVAVVGSECLYRGDFTAQQLAGYIAYVREGIEDESIPVTTSDSADALLANAELGAACDLMMATYYPFFGGVSIDAAADTLEAKYAELQAAFPGKEVIISETGWPTAGTPEGQAVPSEENAAQYLAEVSVWAEAQGVEVVYFSAFDEGWKVEGSANDIGTHWGHFGADGVLKPAYRELYAEFRSPDVADAGAPSAKESIDAINRMLGR